MDAQLFEQSENRRRRISADILKDLPGDGKGEQAVIYRNGALQPTFETALLLISALETVLAENRILKQRLEDLVKVEAQMLPR